MEEVGGGGSRRLDGGGWIEEVGWMEEKVGGDICYQMIRIILSSKVY